MTNENCLRGIKCPACENEHLFRIQVLATATVTDNGALVEHGDMEWDASNYAQCPNCDEHGELAHFMATSEAPESPPPDCLRDAAPYMLAALEQTVPALAPAPRDTDTFRLVELCSRAIAKAKGGAQ